ncbi:GNAT family N-acetyltransferase [Alloiococcus sp. CFN-8]|uniref:GNAT family N-acetyltransferase n=1 Tax=Alloiococcus sp. CFN-8 TaxID=3416081 RepID=UPI003CEB55DE
MKYIRKSIKQDISRIAEILVFTKRMSYRSIFKNDIISFKEMQVLSLAKEYLEDTSKLKNIWVYDDELVKGLINIEQKEIKELYVDYFFENQGIGAYLMDFAKKEFDINHLWVLEKNQGAIAFYKKSGFLMTEERKLEEGTIEYIVKMVR